MTFSISVARIFDWGRQTRNHTQWRYQKVSKEELFVGRNIVEWMIRSHDLVWYVIRILLKGEGLTQKLKSETSKLGDLLSKEV